MNKLQGKKTWIGLVLMGLGIFGLSDIVTPEQLEEGVQLLVKLVGLGIAIYGNYDAHKRLKK